jgi:thymidylate kinase
MLKCDWPREVSYDHDRPMPESAVYEGGGSLRSESSTARRGPEDLLELVDSLVSDRALIFGSLPPHGRDLDLLVTAEDAVTVAAGLSGRGFVSVTGTLARFRDCTVDVVDLVRSDSWKIPESERIGLLAEARPMEGTTRLAVPAPHHALLILARRLARGGALNPQRLARIEATLADDPQAFDKARERANGWGVSASLAVLEHAYRERRGLTSRERARARAEGAHAHGPGRGRRWIRRARRKLTAPRRGVVVTFSGLDGSGKSSQTRYLRDTLDRLGYDAASVWEPIANMPEWLQASTRLVKAPVLLLLRSSARVRRRGGDSPAVSPSPNTDQEPPPGFAWATDHPLTVLRRRSSLLTFGWSMAITVQFAYRIARATWPQLARGRVVICDRYTLDSWVYLLYKFGDYRSYALHRAILRSVSPQPRLAYLLDVPGAVASARKSDFLPERNEHRRMLYRSKGEELGVRRIDGEQPPDRVAAQIAEEVWRTLDATG